MNPMGLTENSFTRLYLFSLYMLDASQALGGMGRNSTSRFPIYSRCGKPKIDSDVSISQFRQPSLEKSPLRFLMRERQRALVGGSGFRRFS